MENFTSKNIHVLDWSNQSPDLNPAGLCVKILKSLFTEILNFYFVTISICRCANLTDIPKIFSGNCILTHETWAQSVIPDTILLSLHNYKLLGDCNVESDLKTFNSVTVEWPNGRFLYSTSSQRPQLPGKTSLISSFVTNLTWWISNWNTTARLLAFSKLWCHAVVAGSC